MRACISLIHEILLPILGLFSLNNLSYYVSHIFLFLFPFLLHNYKGSYAMENKYIYIYIFINTFSSFQTQTKVIVWIIYTTK